MRLVKYNKISISGEIKKRDKRLKKSFFIRILDYLSSRLYIRKQFQTVHKIKQNNNNSTHCGGGSTPSIGSSCGSTKNLRFKIKKLGLHSRLTLIFKLPEKG